MREKAARFILRTRYFWILAMVVACVFSAMTISRVHVNYDLTSYLRSDTDTMRGLALMNGEFESTTSLSVVLIDAAPEKALEKASAYSSLEGVLRAVHDPDTDLRNENGHTYRQISILMSAGNGEEILDAVEEDLKGENIWISGGPKESRVLRESIVSEMPPVMAVSCLIVLIVMLVMTRSWFEPVIFFLVIAVSILLNMGTNWIFSSISFITFAVASILQLALALDYSIMLMNAFDRMRATGLVPKDAMQQALANTFMPISSSAFTTVAGMLSLVFMSFTIGFDIGMVLAKGIVLSMLTVFLFMPGVMLLCVPLIDKTTHRPLRFSGRIIHRIGTALHGLVPVCLIILVVLSIVFQSRTVYTYSARDTGVDAQETNRLFGQSNQVVLLFPKDSSDSGIERQRDMVGQMESLTQDGHPVVQQTLSMVTTGSAAYTYYDAASAAALLGREERDVQTIFNLLRIETPIRGDALIEKLSAALQRISFLVPGDALAQLQQAQELLDQADAAFNGPNYSRAMLVLDLTPGTPEAHDALLQIKAVLRDHYADDSALAGVPVALDDIATSFKGDMLRVNLITIGLILLIILISFRSAVIPLLLVCVIQGAIWINMCVSNILDNSVFFMCYLICVALQMGATVDYGILLTNHYRALRSHVDKKESAREAIRLSLPTILTSGAALSVAGFTVGIISSVFYISSIGTMLARGAIISVSLVLFLLPQLLQWLDRWIVPSYYSE